MEQRARAIGRAVYPVRVAGDGVDAGRAVERERKSQKELQIAPAFALAAHRHGRLAAGKQQAGRRERGGEGAGMERDAGHDLARLARLALDAVREQPGGRPVRRGVEQAFPGRGDQAEFGPLQPLRRFLEPGHRLDPVGRQHAPGIGECCRVGHGRAGGDDGGIVPRHVGYGERHGPGRKGRRRQPPALHRRHMLAHRVDLVDRGARGEQPGRHRPLGLEGDARQRQGKQRRAAA